MRFRMNFHIIAGIGVDNYLYQNILMQLLNLTVDVFTSYLVEWKLRLSHLSRSFSFSFLLAWIFHYLTSRISIENEWEVPVIVFLWFFRSIVRQRVQRESRLTILLISTSVSSRPWAPRARLSGNPLSFCTDRLIELPCKRRELSSSESSQVRAISRWEIEGLSRELVSIGEPYSEVLLNNCIFSIVDRCSKNAFIVSIFLFDSFFPIMSSSVHKCILPNSFEAFRNIQKSIQSMFNWKQQHRSEERCSAYNYQWNHHFRSCCKIARYSFLTTHPLHNYQLR